MFNAMSLNTKLNKLKITYLGQAEIEGPGTGGSARVMDMVSIFNDLGIHVDLINYSFYSNKWAIKQKVVNDRLHVTTIHVPDRYPKFLKSLAIIPFSIYAFKSSRHTDVIFSDFLAVMTSLPAVMLKKMLRKPLILDYIDIATVNIIDILHSLNYTRNADLVFAISPYLVDVAIKKYKCSNVVYLPIFIDTNHFKNDFEARRKIRKDLNISEKEIVIGYVGSFWNVEGLPILLNAFKNLTKKYKYIKLVVVGKQELGPQFDQINNIVFNLNLGSSVNLISSQPRKEIPKFLSAFDILCCPKIDCEINRAANPVKVAEYLSMGKPIVSSAIGGITDTIDDGIDGILVRPGDIENLEEKIEMLLTNPELANSIAEKSREKAIMKHSFSSIRQIVFKSLNEVISMDDPIRI